MRHCLTFLLASLAFLIVLPIAALADATVAQQIVVRRAVDLIPEDVAPIFRDNVNELEERCLEPDTRWAKDPEKRDRARWHYVMLDLEARDQTRAGRLDAASRFPHEVIAARRLYNRLNRRDAGLLPWTIEDLFQQLVDAFEDGTPAKVIEAAGHLAHFAIDAALPFNATVDRDGTESGNFALRGVRPGDRQYENQNLRRRVLDELIRRNRTRYAEQIGFSAEDAERIANPLERSFTVLTEALGTLDDVLAADQAVIVSLNVVDESSFGEAQEKYYDQLDQRCGEWCVQRLRAATLFSGNLIAGAWSVAGRPTADAIRARGATAAAAAVATAGKPKNSTAAPIAPGSFVGSKNSNVYHRPDCEWALKIAPGNLVRYGSAKEAIAAGRHACTKCKPG